MASRRVRRLVWNTPVRARSAGRRRGLQAVRQMASRSGRRLSGRRRFARTVWNTSPQTIGIMVEPLSHVFQAVKLFAPGFFGSGLVQLLARVRARQPAGGTRMSISCRKSWWSRNSPPPRRPSQREHGEASPWPGARSSAFPQALPADRQPDAGDGRVHVHGQHVAREPLSLRAGPGRGRSPGTRLVRPASCRCAR